jgi:hypothetical protein
MSLLDKALKANISKRTHLIYTDEEIELAIAWLESKIGMHQVAIAQGLGEKGRNNIYTFLSICLREGFRKGFIKLSKMK